MAIVIALLTFREVAARCYVKVFDITDPRVAADGYRDAKWAAEYFRAYNDLGVDWHPYVYWIGRPFTGRYIHIDSAGNRHNWREPSVADWNGKQVRIFLFGGSTMWGDGARDPYTIESWLQRLLDRQHACAEVVNWAGRMISTQGLLYLLAQVQHRNVSDLAIFYDGYNDILSAVANGTAGVIFDESARRSEFNRSNPVRVSLSRTHGCQ